MHEIVCVSVNDPFVMEAWGKDQGAEGKVRMLADTCGDLAKALELELDLAAVLGSVRCKRFSMLVEDGTVSKLNVEPDGGIILDYLIALVDIFDLRHRADLQPG